MKSQAGANAAQRKQLAEAFDRSASRALTHVFSNSAFVRGVVTAFSWVLRQVQQLAARRASLPRRG